MRPFTFAAVIFFLLLLLNAFNTLLSAGERAHNFFSNKFESEREEKLLLSIGQLMESYATKSLTPKQMCFCFAFLPQNQRFSTGMDILELSDIVLFLEKDFLL